MASLPPVVVVGAGRMGWAITRALRAKRVDCWFAVRRPRRGLPRGTGSVDDPATFRDGRWIILATGDQAIEPTARHLARLGVITSRMVVWHLSGALGGGALAPLRSTGAALGSFHPLQSVAGHERSNLAGAWVGIEGDPRSVRAARRLARTLEMIPVVVPERFKAGYHAAAAMVPLAIVVAADAATRIATDLGIDREAARRMFLPLFRGVVENLATLTPAEALTGPIRRGDALTVEEHLRSLRGQPRELYRFLSNAALRIAEKTVDPKLLRSVRKVLGG